MAGYFYADETGKFFTSSPVKLKDENLIQVDDLPPSLDYRWQVDRWVSPGENIDNTTVEEMRSRNIVNCSDLDKLSVGNAIADWDDLDILYYKKINPKQKSNGIYTTAKGYLAFPQLSWNKNGATKKTSFVFWCGNDSRYFLFGLASKERFNWNSNDYKNVEIGCRLRNRYSVYYQYGLDKELSDLTSQVFQYRGYSTFAGNNYFRFDIPSNGDSGEDWELYRLDSGDPKDWFGGTLKDSKPLLKTPDRSGQTLVPILGDYMGSNHRLLGVYTS